MKTIFKRIESLICLSFILVLLLLPLLFHTSLPLSISYVSERESNYVSNSIPFSYIYYTLPNRIIEEEFGSNYFINPGFRKPFLPQRATIYNTIFQITPYLLYKFSSYTSIIILVGLIQGIPVISIPLGGHAPPQTLISLQPNKDYSPILIL